MMKRLLATVLASYPVLAEASVDCVTLARITPKERLADNAIETAVPYPRIDPTQIIDIFLYAVDRGELRIFDRPLTRDAVDPEQVEYIYTLPSRVPSIRVYARLTRPIPVPAMAGITAVGVTGILNRGGQIVDSLVHCE